jgi:hypothetical protein
MVSRPRRWLHGAVVNDEVARRVPPPFADPAGESRRCG